MEVVGLFVYIELVREASKRAEMYKKRRAYLLKKYLDKKNWKNNRAILYND